MSGEGEYSTANAALLLLRELFLYAGNENNFRPKEFREKYNISRKKYYEALKLLEKWGFVEKKEKKRPKLNSGFKEGLRENLQALATYKNL